MWSISKSLSLGVLLSCFALAANAADILSASKLEMDFASKGAKSQFLQIRNAGDRTAYVAIDVSRVENLGTRKIKLIRNKNPKKLGLLVTPTKLVLKVGKSKKIRLTNLTQAGDKDIFFRVNANGIRPPKKTEETKEVGIGLQLNVGIGTSTLVIVRPKVMKPEVKIKQIKHKLLFINTGNTTIQISNLSQCRDEKDCKGMGAITLYPGTERTRDVAYKNSSSVLSYAVIAASQQKKGTFDIKA